MTDAAAPSPVALDQQIESARALLVASNDHGSPEYKRDFAAYEGLMTALAAGRTAAPVVPTDPAARDARLTELRARMLSVDQGSPEYKRALDEYEAVLSGPPVETPAAPEPGTPEAVVAADVAAVTELTTAYELHGGATWDQPLLAEVPGVIRAALGEAAVEQLTMDGVRAIWLAQRDIAGGAQLSAETAEQALRTQWGDKYDDNLDSASAAWDRLPAAIRKNLNDSGARWHPGFITFMAEAGARLPHEGDS